MLYENILFGAENSLENHFTIFKQAQLDICLLTLSIYKWASVYRRFTIYNNKFTNSEILFIWTHLKLNWPICLLIYSHITTVQIGVINQCILPRVLQPTWSGSGSESRSVMSNSLGLHGLYSPWNSPGQNTGVGSLALLQGIFPTQGLNPALPHCRWILYQLNHQGRPRILEWLAYLISRQSSWSRNQTRVSCIAGRFFTNWAMREALRTA